MKTTGKHLLVEYFGCDRERLDDRVFLEQLFREAAEATGASIVAVVFHPFYPSGVSGVVVIAESHLSVHTWPSQGYAAVDLYTCGNCDPRLANPVILNGLRAEKVESLLVDRGLTGNVFSISVGEHQIAYPKQEDGC